MPRLKERTTIINTSSIEAVQPEPMLAYAATKAAIVNFTTGLAKEMTPKGIPASTRSRPARSGRR